MTGARVGAAFVGAYRSIRGSGRQVLAVIAALAVAAGASQAVWIVWDEVVARPLPFPDSGALVELVVEEGAPGRPPVLFDLEVPFLAEHTTLFASLGAWQWNRGNISDGVGERSILIAETGPGVLDLLRVAPAAGRLPTREDHPAPERAGAGARVVVLADRLARSLFSSPSEAVGTEILLDDRPVRVVAVMPPRFVFPTPAAEAWRPAPVVRSGPLTGLVNLRSTNVVGRLRPDASPAAASAEATAVLHRAGMPAPLQRDAVRLGVRRLADQASADFRPSLEALRAGALLLLLVGAIGASSLRASQAIGERRAAWVRRSLGATLADDMLTTLARVTLLGAAVGVAGGLVAGALTPLLRPALAHLGDQGLTGIRRSLVGGGVLLAVAGVALAEFFAFAVSFRTGEGPPGGARATGSRAGVRASLALTGLAAAGSTVLATGTVLLVTSARNALRGDFAVPLSHLAQLSVDFRPGSSGGPAEEILDRLTERFAAVPGIEAAGYGNGLPHSGSGELIDGGAVDGDVGARAILRRISPSLLATMGLPVEEGRGILAADREPAEAVAVIDRRLARRLGETTALGRFLTTASGDFRIVGIVPEIAPFLQGMAPAEGVALTHFSRPTVGNLGGAPIQVVARCAAPCSADLVAALRSAVPGVDPGLRVLSAGTIDERRRTQIGAGLLTSVAIAVFGAAGLVLALVGTVGQTWNAVGARSRSLAIRHALGATPRVVRRDAVRSLRAASLGGVAFGLIAAWFAARLIGSRMEWVAGGNPVHFVAPAAAVALLALAATAFGARRIDLTDLRHAIRGGRTAP